MSSAGNFLLVHILFVNNLKNTFSGLLYSQARNAVHDTGKALVLASQSQLANMRTIAGTKHIFI